MCSRYLCFFFFFNDTATTEIYTLSLHDALPIYRRQSRLLGLDHRDVHGGRGGQVAGVSRLGRSHGDRKSTRLNSSHANISYAVFCLKKKKKYRSRAWISRTSSGESVRLSIRPHT